MKKTFLLLFLIQCCYSHAQQEISNNILINKTINSFVESLKEKHLLTEKDTIFIHDDTYKRKNDTIYVGHTPKNDGYYVSGKKQDEKDILIDSLNFKFITNLPTFRNSHLKFYYVYEFKVEKIDSSKIHLKCLLVKYTDHKKYIFAKRNRYWSVETIFEKYFTLNSTINLNSVVSFE